MSTQPIAGIGEATFTERFEAIVENVGRVLQGKYEVARLALCCLLSEGHLLVEDIPGVGKTTLAKALARSLDCPWQRVQFTPDLLPSDVTGVSIYNRADGTFQFRPGAVFASVVLADEINRASPKTQSALLEAMEERQVTVDGSTYLLPKPFMVIATQNPLEHVGTYPLPDSQMDRFLMRVEVGYPDRAAELSMLETYGDSDPFEALAPVVSVEEIAEMVATTRSVHVAPPVAGYLIDIAETTRRHPALLVGISPRAVLGLQRASRAWAAVLGRRFVTPDDVRAMASTVLPHRLVLSEGPGATSASAIVEQILDLVPVPVASRQGHLPSG